MTLLGLSLITSKNKLSMCKSILFLCILESIGIPEPNGFVAAVHNLALGNMYVLCYIWSPQICD